MTENELRRMQDEALRRTREMQKRADEARLRAQAQRPAAAEAAQPPTEPPPAPAPAKLPQERAAVNADTRAAPREAQGSGGALEFLFRDKEKTLILGLLLLLMDEKTDNSLLLALMYLLL